ncbi:hypothetical protein [Mycolicibacterium goodii]|uniref:Uncharacterized protein n=1 Tax=Mycolicibacterium goodii TaxID=134601 RepID=A0ABS6HWN2_MYCGD|nr:hypothetical protein [Mycolicibacterium goodii]MBU8827082.1 hypothetical protein [Mycolicibacterium goodii]MBU8840790.1 hypothetical protein [Mycolicibacterium goodii]
MSPTTAAGSGFTVTRTQIAGWQSQHLVDVALYLRSRADESFNLFDQARRNIEAPSGTEWTGEAKDEAATLLAGDLSLVRRQGEVQAEAAAIAEQGEVDVRAAKLDVSTAIAEAEADGFRVSEDLSVTDTRRADVATLSARYQAMRVHADTIRWRAEQLVQTDSLVGKRLSEKADELIAIKFPKQGTGIHAVDFRQSPPPVNPPYPINDILATATDLDGNKVVLRRGYYDAATKTGFGWDKAYWKHGIINMNIFQDLISHSRPVSNDNGTLVYEVPIDRVHCTPGFLGIPNCQNTGQRVVMRIVANINPGNPDVPDGGQKGLITMYPLPGGSGVVQLGKNWTVVPPWVNHNVPIN